MFYYEVACGGISRGSRGIFTYSHTEKLTIGQYVTVVLQNKRAFGFIVKISSKPEYETSQIVDVGTYVLPPETVATYLRLRSLYPLSDRAIANLFLPPEQSKKISLIEEETTPRTLPTPNQDQQRIIDEIATDTRNVLLHGDTGTGKTRIYTHIAQHYMQKGKTVVVLAPEIGLASFVYQDMSPYFAQSFLYHSKLTKKQRSDIWASVYHSDKPLLLVGPRSVLNLPLKNVGLIIIDESHDQSYRQENAPYINAKTIASILATEHNARIVHGSATPLVTDVQQAKSLNLPILRLTTPAMGTDKASSVKIVSYEDKNERQGGSLLKSSIVAIGNALNAGGQALVLINRRGTARYVSCGACGHESRCATCDRLLTYHHDTYELRCHHCDRKYPVPSKCEQCGEAEISMKAFGSKAVVDELAKKFPEAIVKRFDTDTHKKDHLLTQVDALKDGEVQIIVGTQMIAKGLDLPKLKTLIVLAGGSATGYMSEEREFELLYQVLGRALRGHQNNEVIVQTSNPESKVLKWAVDRDYDSFLSSELSDRKRFYYPPYCYMMLIHIRRKTSKGASKSASDIRAQIAAQFSGVMLGPATPNTNERLGPFYHWHVVVKSPKRSKLTEIAEHIGTGFSCELDPVDIP